MERITTHNYGENMLDITGPLMMGKALRGVLGPNHIPNTTLGQDPNQTNFFEGDYQTPHTGKYRLLTYNGEDVTWQGRKIFTGKFPDYQQITSGYARYYLTRTVFKSQSKWELGWFIIQQPYILPVLIILTFLWLGK
jgi:hypothetical protein